MKYVEGFCVGCNEITTDTIECNCRQAVSACESCCQTDAPLRCATCRERRQRLAMYPCVDFRGDPESGRDIGSLLPVAAPVGAWGPV